MTSPVKILRKVAGRHSMVEQQARSLRNMIRFKAGRPIVRRDFYVAPGKVGPPLGIMAMGGCDTRAVVGAGPILKKTHPGTVCVTSLGSAQDTRSDFMLQTLAPPTEEMTAEVTARLDLAPGYFQPRLFGSHFELARQAGVGPFPVSAVVLSISTDTARTLYRHREHGFLVDPGGWWLAGDVGNVLADKSVLRWFATTFQKAGRISIEESMANFERIIGEIRLRSGAYVAMMNVLSVDPGRGALDYKFSNNPHRHRRREFNIALAELGRRLDFPILDVDRITKQVGIAGQADFVHYAPEQTAAIADEFAAMLRDAGVVSTGAKSPDAARVT